MGPLFMAAVVACRSLNNIVLNTVAKTRIKSRSGHYLFATLASAVALIFVIIISRGIPEIESVDILHGIILGALAIGEEFFLLSALECGSMAMTMVCTLMAFALTHVIAVPLWGSVLDGSDIIGIILAFASVLLLVLDIFNKGIEGVNSKETAGIKAGAPENAAESERGDKPAANGASAAVSAHAAHERHEFLHWRRYAIILIVFTALVEIEEKSHSMAAVSENHMGYYFIAFLTGVILAGGLFLWRNKGRHEPTQFVWDWKFILMFVFCGIMKALIYIVVGLAAAQLTEELVSMINSCALIIILVLIDRFYYKTHFHYNNYIASVLAIAAMILMR